MHGASYVPLDLDAPEDRKAFIASEAKLAAIVSGQADIVAGMVPIVVDLALTPVHDAALLPDPGIVPASEAYVIFPSVSTGRPKSVAITQGNLSNPVAAPNHAPPGRPNPGLRLYSSIIFVTSSTGIFTTPSLHV